MYILSSNKALKKSFVLSGSRRHCWTQCKVQLEVLYLIQAIPNQFHNLLPILYHFYNLPWVWKVAVQKGCHSHHQYHCNLGLRNYQKCPIQMFFELEELNLKVVMMGLEMRVETILGMEGKVVGML